MKQIKLITDYRENAIVYEDILTIISSRKYWEKLFNKIILVTGAYGSIARYFVFVLIEINLRYNANIKIYLNGRNKGKMNYYYGCFFEFNFLKPIYVDLDDDFEQINNISFDYIIHAASIASPELFSTKPVEVIRPNIIITDMLLRRYKHSNMLFFSTGSVYGNCLSNNITEEENGYVDFNQISSSYAESKRMAELLCKSYASEYNVNVKMARIHHTYGPTLDLNNDKRAFSDFLEKAISKGEIIIHTSGNMKRSFLYISEAILGLYDMLMLGKKGESYNLVNSHNFISIKDLAKIIANISNIKYVVENKEASLDINSDRQIVTSNAKLKKLGWDSKITPLEGFTRTYKAFKLENL